ncbi:MAG: hypothetical protein A2603_02680 [Bdellovibrionales bacterium RIFOXYD1_FULL_55_31]|nr:MAG: hypothetical protein A2603_02680 [Bdellovibrionales bacterium RIFOXYD1_FULL_55_31]
MDGAPEVGVPYPVIQRKDEVGDELVCDDCAKAEDCKYLPDWDETQFLVLVPEHLQNGLRGYFVHGHIPGDFLTSVLENDLLEAVTRADEDSFSGLRGLVIFLWNYTPSSAWGSRENVGQWVEERKE